MFKNLFRVNNAHKFRSIYYLQKQTFLSKEYKCAESWSSQTSSQILNNVNLNDFYNTLEQNYISKGVISAIDVDIFANAIRDPAYLEELKDLLHKLRLSAETINTLESTHHATIRNFIDFGHINELLEILKNPLSFGVFLDTYTTNILLDKLIHSEDYENAATVASLVMLQEDYDHEITCSLCQYASFKYITTFTPAPPQEPVEPTPKNKKVEEIKIRVKYLRNPYFDDHFDIKDTALLSGKTLAWLSKKKNDNLNVNLQIIGWLFYKKYDQLLNICEKTVQMASFKVFTETIDLLKREIEQADCETNDMKICIAILDKAAKMDASLESALKNSVENAINKCQNNDISSQKQLFNSWINNRQTKLEEQIKRLDRAKRVELIGNKQKQLEEEEQKLWFFENEETIDLQIEEKEKLENANDNKKAVKSTDENYIPPEILPQRRK